MNLEKLKSWFNTEKRELPWRKNLSPYAVWVSEVMLQQTQVDVVIPYFLRWMTHFPTIQDLANAPLAEVIKLWEGLGYYSRARNLHAGAKQVLEQFAGKIPISKKELLTIKGLGPYTVGALLSFAFHQKTAAVDGNVIRVLSRHFQIEDEVKKPAVLKKIWQLAENLLPEDEHWVVNEALIELGATICQKKPHCSQCPIRSSCMSYLNGKATILPMKAPRKATIFLKRLVAVIVHQNHVLLQRGEPGKIMEGLHEFPYFEDKGFKNPVAQIQEELGISVKLVQVLPEQKHSFTSYSAHLFPYLLEVDEKKNFSNLFWMPLSKIPSLAFSSGHRRVLKNLCWDLLK